MIFTRYTRPEFDSHLWYDYSTHPPIFYLLIIYKSFINHLQIIHKSFTNHSQIIHKSFMSRNTFGSMRNGVILPFTLILSACCIVFPWGIHSFFLESSTYIIITLHNRIYSFKYIHLFDNLQIIYKSFINHLQIIHKLLTNYSQITYKLFTNYLQIIYNTNSFLPPEGKEG